MELGTSAPPATHALIAMCTGSHMCRAHTDTVVHTYRHTDFLTYTATHSTHSQIHQMCT
jgi:hypothetical protein